MQLDIFCEIVIVKSRVKEDVKVCKYDREGDFGDLVFTVKTHLSTWRDHKHVL